MNVLLVGIYADTSAAAALTKLRRFDGSWIEVGQSVDSTPWAALAQALQDTAIIGADTVHILANVPMDFRKMDYPALDGKWVKRFEKDRAPRWFYEFKQPNFTVDHVKFVVLRQLFRYEKWRFSQIAPAQLANTQRLLVDGVSTYAHGE